MKRCAVCIQKIIDIFAITAGRTRSLWLTLRGADIGPKVTLGARCKVTKPWCVKLGTRSFVEADVYLKAVTENALLNIGSFVFIGRGTEFDVMERVSVGDHTQIAPGCFITDHNHGSAADLRIDQQPCVVGPVVIGSDVWLGVNVTILAGVTIGDGAVVAAHAVVTKDVPPMSIVAGVPARLLKDRG
jgi:acetyltransferase-like isoleucine patch superfamily enzyme